MVDKVPIVCGQKVGRLGRTSYTGAVLDFSPEGKVQGIGCPYYVDRQTRGGISVPQVCTKTKGLCQYANLEML